MIHIGKIRIHLFRNVEKLTGVVNIEETSARVFKGLLDLLYGEPVLDECQDWDFLFELLRLSDMYDVQVVIYCIPT